MTKARICGLLLVLLGMIAGNCVSVHAQEKKEGQQPPLRVRVSERVSQSLLVKKVQPEYPREAREKHVQGTVKLKAEISKEGNVTDLTVVSGDPLLAPAAMEAVKQWKYKPYLLNGQPVIVETQVSVLFELQSN